MKCINEALYFYMKSQSIRLPDDWNNREFWYTIGCYWIDHCGGGSNLLWLIRKTYNYVTLNDDLSLVEIINRQLSLVHIIKHYPSEKEVDRVTPPPSWTDIIRKSKCSDAHICNYNWICTIFMHEEDKIRVRKTMSLAMVRNHTGFIVTSRFRTQPKIIKDILVAKLGLNVITRTKDR
jgi:hypothetical protein